MSKKDIELSVLTIDNDLLSSVSSQSHISFKITGEIPNISYFICLVEFCERFSYYMITGCLTNMLQRDFPQDSITGAIVHNISKSTETPGALNLGLPLANFTMQLLTFFANISPIISGYYSDTKLGKFKSVILGVFIGIIGHFVLVISSIPSIMKFPFLSFSIVLLSVLSIAASAGFIKANILPLLLDQYEYKLNKSDYRVIDGKTYKIDHQATLGQLSMSFYLFINWGCTFALFGPFMERYLGFWFVYLFTAILFAFLPLLLNYIKPRIIHHNRIPSKPHTSYLNFYYHLKRYAFNTPMPLIDSDIEIDESDILKFFNCIILFLFFIPFYINDSSLISVQISLAATMSTSYHFPNDFYQSFNPIAIIITIPILSNIIYPYLLKRNRMPSSRMKIIIGFTITSIGTLLGAFVQYKVYFNSICAISEVSKCSQPSNVSLLVWVCYILMFVLQAVGECFAATTCYELAYQMAPAFLKSSVLALFLSSVALSSLLGEFLSIWAKDPYLVNVFLISGLLGLSSTLGFAIWSKHIESL